MRHQQSFNFFRFFVNFWRLSDVSGRKDFLGELEAERLAVTGRNFFFPLSQEETFLKAIEKNAFFIIYKSLVTKYQIWHSWAMVILLFFSE